MGASSEDLLKSFDEAKYGPMSHIIDDAISDLVNEGKLHKSKAGVYEKEGTLYSLSQEIEETELNLPFEISELKIPSYIPAERRIIQAKEHYLNNLADRSYHWNVPWNLRFAYSIYRESLLPEGLLCAEETYNLIDILFKIDQLFKFPCLPWRATYGSDPYVPPLKEFKNNLLTILRQKSYTGNEKDVAETLKDLASSNGLYAEVDDDSNLYVVHKGKNPEKIALIFHLDTVRSSLDPFVKDGVLYGPGAVDNKAACLAGLYSLIMLARNHIIPNFSALLLGASSEETADRSKRGIIKVIRNRKHLFSTISLAIIGEASGKTCGKLPQLNYSLGERARWTGFIPIGCRIKIPVGEIDTGTHVAHIEDEVKWIKNKSRESLLSWIHLRDIRFMTRRALIEIKEIEKSLPETALGKTTITFSEKWSPSDSNQTPCRGTIYFDIRLSHDSYRELIKREMMRILKKWFPPPFYFGENWNENCGKVIDYTKTKAGSDIQRIEKELLPLFKVLGMRRTNYRFGTDAKFILELTKTPVIGLGPGDEHFAHRSDEQVRIFELIRASLIYFTLMQVCRLDRVSDRARIILASRSHKAPYIS